MANTATSPFSLRQNLIQSRIQFKTEFKVKASAALPSGTNKLSIPHLEKVSSTAAAQPTAKAMANASQPSPPNRFGQNILARP
jgi:hypothetical protein